MTGSEIETAATGTETGTVVGAVAGTVTVTETETGGVAEAAVGTATDGKNAPRSRDRGMFGGPPRAFGGGDGGGAGRGTWPRRSWSRSPLRLILK